MKHLKKSKEACMSKMFVSDISDTVSSNREYTVLYLSLSSCTRQLYVDNFDLHYYELFLWNWKPNPYH